MQKILIAEDDRDIRELLKLYLESEGYLVLEAENGKQALETAQKQRPDLAILDIMMPEMSGLDLTRRLREKTMMPILILSARDQDHDKILGLNLGADDYMTKPFNPLELVARVRALLRRSSSRPDVLKAGELCLDFSAHTLMKGNRQIQLTPMEYKILSILMRSPGRIYTKVQLYEAVCGEYFENDENTIMVHISRIREKVEDDPKRPVHIITVRGVGYKFEE
ncbi:MAG: response regulator transcription factor [Firmicutes bacterium]|nr:response regulator transcription factor [Bacillota bacterium]MDY5857046.1 response regulator transcription factor [Anaerovoracaceae bacterium]